MEILEYTFFQNALLGIILIAITSAIIGTYVVTRRMVFIAGGITHTCFGGLGLGYFLSVNPILMAIVFAIAGALGVDLLASKNIRKDSAIAVVWALGMALGILFIFMSSGFVPELNAFLFGNVLAISLSDICLFLAFTLILLIVFLLLYKRIVAISFDEDFARTRHLPVTIINTVMSVLTAVAIVLIIKMIGVMLLVSMITLPVISAEKRTFRYTSLLLFSIITSIITSVAGLFAAYFLSVPASATIVLLQ